MPEENYGWRVYLLGLILLIAIAAIIWRLIDLSVFNRNFLMQQSAVRAVRVVSIPAYRGMITDR